MAPDAAPSAASVRAAERGLRIDGAPAGRGAVASSQGFKAHRLHELTIFSTPIGVVTLFIGGVACLKPLRMGGLHSNETLLESVTMAVYPFFVALPAVVVRTGRLWLLEPTVCASHFIRSMALLSMGLGITPFSLAMQTLLRLRIEMLLEFLLGIQDQVSPLIMAVLHAIRQVAWMSVLVNHMGGSLRHALVRGLLNWLLMMALTCGFELRNWASYCKRLEQQRRAAVLTSPTALPGSQQQRGSRKQAAGPGEGHWEDDAMLVEEEEEEEGGGFVSHLPMPVKPSAAAAAAAVAVGGMSSSSSSSPVSSSSPRKVWAASGSTIGNGRHTPGAHTWTGKAAVQPVPLGARRLSRPGSSELHSPLLVSRPTSTDRTGGGPGSGGSTPPPPPPAPAAAAAAATNEGGTMSAAQEAFRRNSRAEDDMSAWLGEGLELPTVRPPLPAPSGVGRRAVYRPRHRGARGERCTVTVKIDGAHLENMPTDLPTTLLGHLNAQFPSLVLTGLSMRQGCVLLTLDLATSPPPAGPSRQGSGQFKRGSRSGGLDMDPCTTAQRLTEVVSALTRGCGAFGGALQHGHGMSVQVQGSVVVCSWDAQAQGYQALQCLSGSGVTCPVTSASLPSTTATATATVPQPSAPAPPATQAEQQQPLPVRIARLHRLARHCVLRHVPTPILSWMSDGGGGGAGAGGESVTFTVTLQLPPNVRLVGWLPSASTVGAAVAAAEGGGEEAGGDGGYEAAAAAAVASGKDGVERGQKQGQQVFAEVALLVRQQAGPYLPVHLLSTERLSEGGAAGSNSSVEPASGVAGTSTVVQAKVSVQLNNVLAAAGQDQPPLPLRLELWCCTPPASASTTTTITTAVATATTTNNSSSSSNTATTPGQGRLELLVAECLLLALPPSASAATTELHAHVAQLGGVRAHQLLTAPTAPPPPPSPQPRLPQPPSAASHGDRRSAASCGNGDCCGSTSTPAGAPEEEGAAAQEEEDGATCLLQDLNDLLSLPRRLETMLPSAATPAALSSGLAAPEPSSSASFTGAQAARQQRAALSSGLEATEPSSLSWVAQAERQQRAAERLVREAQGAGVHVLLHAVGQGMPAFAGLVVEALVRAEAAVAPAGHGSLLLSGRAGPDEGGVVRAWGWWARAVGVAAGTRAAAGQEQEEDGEEEEEVEEEGMYGSLLHAAMASGHPAMLEMVFRWGKVHGGDGGTAWPWTLQDADGYTPLHLAAAHPPATCVALLRVLGLPLLAPGQAEEARAAWVGALGGVGVSPAQVYALGVRAERERDAGEEVGSRAQQEQERIVGEGEQVGATEQREEKRNECGDCCGAAAAGDAAREEDMEETIAAAQADGIPGRSRSCGPSTGGLEPRCSADAVSESEIVVAAPGEPQEGDQGDCCASCSSGKGGSSAPLHAAEESPSAGGAGGTSKGKGKEGGEVVGAPAARMSLLRWMRLEVSELLRLRRDPEYLFWARRQVAVLVAAWSCIMAATAVSICLRSRDGDSGAVVMVIIHWTYLPTAVSALTGWAWLGDWQAWMLANHVMRWLGFLLVLRGYLPGPSSWWHIVRNRAEVWYDVLQIAPFDQTPLLQMVLMRLLALAPVMGHVFRRLDIANPLMHSAAMHAAGAAVTVVAQLLQVQAYRRVARRQGQKEKQQQQLQRRDGQKEKQQEHQQERDGRKEQQQQGSQEGKRGEVERQQPPRQLSRAFGGGWWR